MHEKSPISLDDEDDINLVGSTAFLKAKKPHVLKLYQVAAASRPCVGHAVAT